MSTTYEIPPRVHGFECLVRNWYWQIPPKWATFERSSGYAGYRLTDGEWWYEEEVEHVSPHTGVGCETITLPVTRRDKFVEDAKGRQIAACSSLWLAAQLVELLNAKAEQSA